jgi:hypothetical protein
MKCGELKATPISNPERVEYVRYSTLSGLVYASIPSPTGFTCGYSYSILSGFHVEKKMWVIVSPAKGLSNTDKVG